MKSPADFDQRLAELCKRFAQSVRNGETLFSAINRLHASANRQVVNPPAAIDWPNKS